MIYDYCGVEPKLDKGIYVADGAKVIGEVELKEGANIWYNAVLRGDVAKIVIGKNSNIQDNSTVHVDSDVPVIIGDYVTVGHNAVIHACTIGDDCLIGMGATILDGAVIGKGSIVGANSLVTGNTIIPPNSLVLGSPAKVVKEIDKQQENHNHAKEYVNLASKHKLSY